MREFMLRNGLTERPHLKDVIDELIEDVQGARLIEEVLPLDRFAQTEAVGGKIVVSINSRIAQIPGVKDPIGVSTVAKWHESIHVARDIKAETLEWDHDQLTLPGFESRRESLIVCRTAQGHRIAGEEREFLAENAGVAAAICGADLARSPSFSKFQRLAAQCVELAGDGWHLLYETADGIGVNASALVRYLEKRRMFQIVQREDRRFILPMPTLFGGMQCI
jgi:hypothetical protein